MRGSYRLVYTHNDYSTDDAGPMSKDDAKLFFEGQEQRVDIHSVELQKFNRETKTWTTIETKKGKAK